MQKLLNTILLSFMMVIPGIQAHAQAAPDSSFDQEITNLRDQWGRIKYQTPDPDQQTKQIAVLEAEAAKVEAEYPSRAEPKIWEAIILATDAGITKSMSGLPKVRHAKELLEAALKEDPNTMGGSAHVTLGSLYYQVPGWPISFGSDKKAEEELRAGLSVNPNGIDTNYFYGDFLNHKGDYNKALGVLQQALKAAPRPGFEIIDQGFDRDINKAIADATEKLKSKPNTGYN